MKTARSARISKRCPQCKGTLSDSSPIGPCPACLMQLGMQSWRDNQSITEHLDPTMAADVSGGGVTPQELEQSFPQYEILHMVGSGGMGTVYCARQKSLNRLVALKVIKPEQGKHAEFADRFVREARAMAHLNHPNIVTVHDFGQVDNLYFFVMEYVDGINLRQMIRGNKLTAKHALEIVPAVCDALQYAHDKGIVHR
ncbi:MAG: serine/threonine-protein kinase, partial [Pirellulaceae bacterium]